MTQELINKAIKLWQDGCDKQAIEILEKIDLEQHGEANTLLGQIYIGAERGVSNIKKDVHKGKKYLEKGLSLGDGEAGLSLATIFYFGDGIKKDFKRAEECWMQSWKLGEEEAGFALANYYFDDFNDKIHEAIEIYSTLNQRKEFVGNCNFKLSKIFAKGIGGVTIDIDKTIKYLIEGVKVNHFNCLMDLALRYYRADGVEKNIQEAIDLVEKATKDEFFGDTAELILRKMNKMEKI